MKRRTAGLLASLIMAAGAACTAPSTTPPADPPPEPDGVGVVGSVPPPREGVLPVDVLIEGRLHRAGGGELSLGELVGCRGYCQVGQVWRVADGWLVSTHGDGLSGWLWRVPESGDTTLLAEGPRFLVSRGTAQRPGVQIAWVSGAGLYLATYAQGQLTRVVSTSAPVVPPANGLGPHPLYPQAVVGDGLVLGGTQTGGGLDFWDVWFPSRGDYRPEAYPVISLHATTPDGQRIIGSYQRDPTSGSKERCLGELDPEEFEAVRSRCPEPFPDYARVYPSPDGRWWIVQQPESVDLYDAEQVWSGAGPTRSLPALGVWLDATSFVVLDGARSFAGYTDGRPDQPIPQTVGPLTPLNVVVDLRGET